jgi:hypothetical protein
MTPNISSAPADQRIADEVAFAIENLNRTILLDTIRKTYDGCVHDFVEGDVAAWDRYHDVGGYRCVKIALLREVK